MRCAPPPGLLVAVDDALAQLQVPVIADVQLRAQLGQHELGVLPRGAPPPG